MACLLKKIVRFVQQEWFLFVMLFAITLVVLVFEML
jgi:hypothetical protein